MNFISSLLSNLNYGTILFLMLLESTVVPVPSEFVVTPAAYHAAGGNLDVFLMILFATIGADLRPLSTMWLPIMSADPSSTVLPTANGARCVC